jgi:hypothetical protein
MGCMHSRVYVKGACMQVYGCSNQEEEESEREEMRRW